MKPRYMTSSQRAIQWQQQRQRAKRMRRVRENAVLRFNHLVNSLMPTERSVFIDVVQNGKTDWLGFLQPGGTGVEIDLPVTHQTRWCSCLIFDRTVNAREDIRSKL